MTLEELAGAASRAAEPERPVRRERQKRAIPGVTVALGDAVTLPGGIRGIVTEFDSDGLWVGVDGENRTHPPLDKSLHNESRDRRLTSAPFPGNGDALHAMFLQ